MNVLAVKLPDVGEGVTEAELVELHVAVGDLVREDDTLAAVMTDKATVEIPSLFSGKVVWIGGDVGDTLAVGSELVRIETDSDAPETSDPVTSVAEQREKISDDVDAPPVSEDISYASKPATKESVQGKVLRAVKLPDVGEGVTEAELAEWSVDVGDLVKEDDTLAAVMTDKATVEIPSLFDGRVIQLGGVVGEVLAVGSDLVLIEVDADQSGEGDAPSAAPEPVTSANVPSAESKERPPAPAKPKSTPVLSGNALGAPRSEGTSPLASPSVRARAKQAGLDLRQVVGTGPAGRITHDDIDSVFDAPLRTSNAVPPQGRAARQGTEEIKVIGMRRKISQRMALANERIPHITVVEEIDVTALEDLRSKLNSDRGDKPKLTVLPFITATLAKAMLEHPEMNAHYLDDDGLIIRHAEVNLGMATMTDAGLVVPVIRNAEALGLFDTASEITRLSEAARTGKAKREELTGSTFTITSLGPLGALATTPIINRPEVAILGINKMATRPMWDGSQFVPRKMMNISASFDHRVIDGWDAAVFAQTIKKLLENPAMIFLEA